MGDFLIGLGIYFECLAFNEEIAPRQSPLVIFLFCLVSVFLGLPIYYVPAVLKSLEMSPLRRYAHLLKEPIRRNTHEEDFLNDITSFTNSCEPQRSQYDASEDAGSLEDGLEDIT